MKNILLVMPRISYAINDWNIPPVGILYVSACMKKAGLPVYTLNLNLAEGEVGDIISKEIQKNSIDIVCTGDLVVNYKAVQEVLDAAKEVKPDIITIMGGGLVTHSPEEAMDIVENADYGVIGEGEITDTELVRALIRGTDIEAVDGVIYRKAGRLVKTQKRKEVENLDQLPWPDYDGFGYFELLKRHSSNGRLSAPLTTSRSCPFNCTFCSKSGGDRYRQRSLESIFSEMDYLVEKYGVTEFFLNDELFADKLDRVSEFCEAIKARGVTWHVMLRISNKIDFELLRTMKDAGCVGICYGLESADDSVLKSMRKGTNAELMKRVLEDTHKAGLNVRGGFIFGDVAETSESVEKTFDWITENAELLGNASISPIVLYPGSLLYDNAVKSGSIKSAKEHILRGCPLVNVANMTEAEYFDMVHHRIPEFASKIRQRFSLGLKKELEETLAVKDGKYIHRFTCRKCKSIIEHVVEPTDMFQKHVDCKTCGEKYDFFPNFLYFETFEEDIKAWLSRDNTAIWGTGETLNCLYEAITYLKEKEIVLIDSDELRQQEGFRGMKVYSPKAIQEKEIKNIVCCVGNVVYMQLKDIIKREHPDVNMIWINEIGLEEKGKAL